MSQGCAIAISVVALRSVRSVAIRAIEEFIILSFWVMRSSSAAQNYEFSRERQNIIGIAARWSYEGAMGYMGSVGYMGYMGYMGS